MRRAVTVLCAVTLVACGGGDQSSTTTPITSPPAATPGTTPTAPTATTPSTTLPRASTPTAPPPDAGATTTEAPSTPTTLPPAEPPAGTGLTFIVIDGDGVHRDGLLVVPGAIAWADDDEIGGIVYRPFGGGATIQWLPSGADQPIETGFLHGLVGTTPTGPVIVTFHDPPVGKECGGIVSDFVYEAVNGYPLDRATGIGLPDLITCNAEGADSGYITVSYRNGHLLQVLTEAAAWMYNDREFVLLDPGGHHVALPASAFGGETAWWEQQRELDGVLSPDASLIAVRQRLDNHYSNGPDPETGEVDIEDWERLTAAIPSTIRVVDLATGTIHYETQVPYGVELGDFDGRYLALVDGSQSTIVDTHGATAPTTLAGVVVFTRASAESQPAVLPEATPPTVRQGDAGPWVSHLQLRLHVHDPSVGLAVDGQFGPATDAAVREFQAVSYLTVDGVVGPKTWTALTGAEADIDLQVPVPDTALATVPAVTEPTSGEPALQAVLRSDGLGPVGFGTPANEAIATLTNLLGPPDSDIEIGPLGPGSDGCVSWRSWLGCISENQIVEQGRVAAWTNYGLEVAFTDAQQQGADKVVVPLHLSAWWAEAPSTGATPTTAEGLRPGSTVGELRELYPDVEFNWDEMIWVGFSITSPAGSGERPINGGFEWTWDGYVKAVQRALNAQGADVAVDGMIGPATEHAWFEFCGVNDLDCIPAPAGPESLGSVWLITEEERAALDFPPSDVRIGFLST